MSLTDLVGEVEGLLPPKVHSVLMEIAKEVEAHKTALSDLASVGGPVAETVATGVEDVSSAVENTETATAAPSTTCTSGEGDPLSGMTEDTGTSRVGNPEQSLPYEQWPKAE